MNATSQPPQTLGILLSRTFAFLREHLRLVISVTLPVVAFVDLVIAAGLGMLSASNPHKPLPVADWYIISVGTLLVTVPLVTAMLARATVISLGRTDRLSAREIAVQGLDLFAPSLFVVIMFVATAVIGLWLLIVPGIYVLFSYWFVVQAVAIDGCRGTAAMKLSHALVRGRWWRTAGIGVGVVAVTQIPALLIASLFEQLGVYANSDALVVIGSIVSDTFMLPFAAVSTTLYYLELRERAGMPGPR